MKSFTEFLLEKTDCTIYNQQQIKDLEKFADRLLDKWDIDIEFSKHFAERISDSRNNPCIKISELQQLFKKIERDKGKKIKTSKDYESVLVDISKDLNLPFVMEIDNEGEFTIRFKTIMRKKNFATPDKKIVYEKKAFSGGDVDLVFQA